MKISKHKTTGVPRLVLSDSEKDYLGQTLKLAGKVIEELDKAKGLDAEKAMPLRSLAWELQQAVVRFRAGAAR